jgi:hypothetical protein
MKKLILIAAIAIITLTSCGKTTKQALTVQNAFNDRIEYLHNYTSSEYDRVYKVGDTVRYDERDTLGYVVGPVYGIVKEVSTEK